jgi:hypothetical protein
MSKRNTTEATYLEVRYTVAKIWGEIAEGDAIKVTGERGKFTFTSVYLHDGVVTSVNAIGGMDGHNEFRSFRPERVKKVVVKKSRKKEVVE